jgi:hypothetical protein
MVVSTGPRVDYCFMSNALQDFDGLSWPRRGQILPDGSATDRFNGTAENVRLARRANEGTDLRDWFGGRRSIPATEEIIGLGSYGKTLTIMSSDVFPEDEDDEEGMEERWTPRFRR